MTPLATLDLPGWLSALLILAVLLFVIGAAALSADDDSEDFDDLD